MTAVGMIVGGVAGVIVGGLIGWGVCAWKRRLTRIAVFAYDVLYFIVLVALGMSYLKAGTGTGWSVRGWIPLPLHGLPSAAIWFGALGGAMISLKGVYDHDQKASPGHEAWEEKLNLWHVGRPITSGVSGGMTYLFLLFISGSEPKGVAVYVAAFIIGMQERRFLALLSKVASLVLGMPGEQPPTMGSPTANQAPLNATADTAESLGADTETQ